MNRTLILFVALLVSTVANAFAEQQSIDSSKPRINPVFEITDKDVTPKLLVLPPDDLSIFVLNNTTASRISFEIDYGKTIMHCANPAVVNTPDGKSRTAQPLAPRDFAATCFHEPGTYPIKISGLPGMKAPIEVTVKVGG